ncbi:cation transporter [bacterium]|nr:cation transporter [bacterium]
MDDNKRAAARIMALVLTLNLAAAVVKFIISLLANSAVLRGDAYYSAIDALVDVVLLVMLRLAARPPDENHPYGHAKFEAVAVAVVAVMIFAMLQDLFMSAWHRLSGNHIPRFDPFYMLVLAATLIFSLLLAIYQIREARRLNSPSLRADGAFTFSGCALTGLSMLSLLGGRAGLAWPDSAGAFLACGMILWAGWHVGRDALAALLDEVRIDETRLLEVVLEVPGVGGCHQIRSRGLPDHIHVDLHIQVDPAMSVYDSHKVAHAVEDMVMAKFPGVQEVAVHVEPLSAIVQGPQPEPTRPA